jgi:hypothetical protein
MRAGDHFRIGSQRPEGRRRRARIWRHAGKVGVSDHYQEKGAFQQLMDRLRKVVREPDGSAPVLNASLCV